MLAYVICSSINATPHIFSHAKNLPIRNPPTTSRPPYSDDFSAAVFVRSRQARTSQAFNFLLFIAKRPHHHHHPSEIHPPQPVLAILGKMDFRFRVAGFPAKRFTWEANARKGNWNKKNIGARTRIKAIYRCIKNVLESKRETSK